MSALPPETDIIERDLGVRSVSKVDIVAE